MTTITDRTRRAIMGARVTPALIELSAQDAATLADELSALAPDPAKARDELFAGMLSGVTKFMGVSVKLKPSDRAEAYRKQAEDVARDLRREFGYVPDERGGDNWTVYQNHTLIVCHPERRPRLYKRGCGGAYYEIEPNFP